MIASKQLQTAPMQDVMATWENVTSDSVSIDLEVEDEGLEEKMNNLFDYSYVVHLKSTKELGNHVNSVETTGETVK